MQLNAIALATLSLALAPALASAAPTPGGEAEISWHQGSFEEALGQARAESKPLVLYFWMEGSERCAQMYAYTLQSEHTIASLESAVAFSVPHSDAARYPLFETYGVTSLPTVLMLSPEGEVDDGIAGLANVNQFVLTMRRVQAGKETVGAMKARMSSAREGSSEQLDVAWKLADRYNAIGYAERAEELYATIRKLDPKGKTSAGASVLFKDKSDEVFAELRAAGADGGDGGPTIADVDLGPLYKLLKKTKHDRVRFQVYDQLGNVELAREDQAKAIDCYQRAWKAAPDDQILDWGAGVVASLVALPAEQRSSKEKKVLLSMARDLVERTEAIDQSGEWWQATHPVADWNGYLAFRLEGLAGALALNGDEEAADALLQRVHSLVPERDGDGDGDGGKS